MEQTDPHRRRRNPYRIRDARIWALVRMRYLRGESAPRLAEAYGLTEYAIRQRIRREGWSKRGLAEAEAACVPEPEELAAQQEAADEAPDDGFDPVAAARTALARAARLTCEGRMGAAAEAARVADVMTRAAARLAGGEAGDDLDDEAELEAVQRKVEEMIAAARAEGAREARGG